MHFTNVTLYVMLCVTTIPIFNIFLGKGENGSSVKAFFASVLFAIHPVHTEVVAGLVGRADLLSSTLFFLSVILYNEYLRKKSYRTFLTIILVITAAMLCKETAITALVSKQ